VGRAAPLTEYVGDLNLSQLFIRSSRLGYVLSDSAGRARLFSGVELAFRIV
jgi:hypothetical protein